MNNISYKVPLHSCCGCGACINICEHNAICYGKDKYGFIVPVLANDKCVECGLCVKVCPSLNSNKREPITSYAAIAKDETLLMKSSSGAVFGTIALNVLNAGGVVYGCTMTDDYIVKHIRVDEIKDLYRILRSKYVQSDLGQIFKEIKRDIKDGLMVLFSGTPCQVSAVRRYIGDKPNLYTIDVVCHGVPSQDFFDSFISYLESNSKYFEGLIFRAKRMVQNGMNWYLGIKYKGNTGLTIQNWPEEAYTFYYMNSLINRESCYECKYTTISRVGDLTLCDYWKWNRYHHDFKTGSTVSGILVNSAKGEALIKGAHTQLELVLTNVANIVRHNSCLRTPACMPDNRTAILDTWKERGYNYLSTCYKVAHRKKRFKAKVIMSIPQRILNILESIIINIRR